MKVDKYVRVGPAGILIFSLWKFLLIGTAYILISMDFANFKFYFYASIIV